ncbi:hypothetical protein L1049_008465 [Liquidambar formosana]|uniref:Uncharacterized protein n=1 Tax=Liquidambar formosana TaxID=63359 RepID=A0AAP0S3K1_LIQFO
MTLLSPYYTTPSCSWWCSLLQSEQERTKTLLYSQPTVFIDVLIGDFPITPSRSRKDCDGEQWKFSAESDEIRFVEMRVEGLSTNKTAHFSVILEVSFEPSLSVL